jgi:hypothetical protein
MEHELMMKDATRRSIVRWIHVVCAIPIIGYIYSPFEVIPDYAPATRFIFVPVMLLSGLWMWKGHVLRRLIPKRSAGGRRRDPSGAQTKAGEFSFGNQESRS